MAKKEKKIELNRNRYNQIRKMDHYSMQLCVEEYYKQGYKAGYDTAKQEFLEKISQIKGIGTARLEMICQSLNKEESVD